MKAACEAWNSLVTRPETITSIGMRDRAHRSIVKAVGLKPLQAAPLSRPSAASRA